MGCTNMALKLKPPLVLGHKNGLLCHTTKSFISTLKPNGLRQTSSKPLSIVNMAAGHSDKPVKLSLDNIMDKARSLWENSPEPVKSFPWGKARDNFIQLVLDLILAVIKCLALPLFVVTSVSEISYCAHERKLFLVPIPFLMGVAFVGGFNKAALTKSQHPEDVEMEKIVQNLEVPWHLVMIAIILVLLKLPGPYYPYWGRIFIPHFANGALLRTLWLAFQWNRRPQKPSEESVSSP